MSKQGKVVKVSGVEIGSGMPKLCVSVHAENESELYEKTQNIANIGVDLLEWRVDSMSVSLSNDKLIKCLSTIKGIINAPIIFTLRTGNEGGARSISEDYYLNLNRGALNSGLIDIVDIEMYFNKAITQELVEIAKNREVPVILSNHDTQKTPEKDELVRRLLKMQETGADIAKIAAMPKSKMDVVRLLEASIEAGEQMDIPLIAISMGKEGLISRIAGEFTGSAIAYGARSIENALGQATAEDQKKMLALVHKYSNIVK